jgi:hypothetical protein
MTNTELISNFNSIAAALHDDAPSQKARDFIDRLADSIRARGEDWIAAHQSTLHIEHNAEWHDEIAPVEDNRLWWTAQWQMASGV